jgi:hypothetical protein
MTPVDEQRLSIAIRSLLEAMRPDEPVKRLVVL